MLNLIVIYLLIKEDMIKSRTQLRTSAESDIKKFVFLVAPPSPIFYVTPPQGFLSPV
jgi:hypothetical protein